MVLRETFLETIQRPEARDFSSSPPGRGFGGRESELVDCLANLWQLEVKIDDGEIR